MEIGRRIDKLRKELGFSQMQLCKGIISSAHLSNIKQGRYIPPQDVLELLAKRLQVPTDYLVKYLEKNEQLGSYLDELGLLLEQNQKQARLLMERIEQDFPLINGLIQEIHFLLLICLLAYKQGELQKANEIYENQLTPLIDSSKIDDLPNMIQSFYYKATALYHYYEPDYFKTYEALTKQLSVAPDPVTKADALYNIGLTLLSLFEVNKGIFYVEHALSIYLENQLWYKSCKAHNLLGGLYWEESKFHKAEMNLNEALELADTYGFSEIKPHIFHNYGILYNSYENTAKALEYFNKSLELKKTKKSSSHDRCKTYLSILAIYIKMGAIDLAKDLLQLARLSCINTFEEMHLKTIEAQICLKEGMTEQYIALMDEAIHFFYEKGRWRQVQYFAEELGDFFYKNKKYKQSTAYYRMSVDCYKNQFRRSSNERV